MLAPGLRYNGHRDRAAYAQFLAGKSRRSTMLSLNVNGKRVSADAEDDTPLLWVLRDHLNMTGTKFGCGMALCGACTVHVDGQPTRSCTTPASAVAGKRITTIE